MNGFVRRSFRKKTKVLSIAAVCSAAFLAGLQPAAAQDRCTVTDPTGTPLNIRAAPNGRKLGTLPNGLNVSIVRTGPDNKGRPWALIRPWDSGRVEGWVFREFISCY